MEEVKVRLKDLNSQELQNLMKDWSEKRFHGKQIFAALFKRGVRSVADMTDLPLKLRDKLARYEPLDLATVIATRNAPDGTTKFLFKLHDESKIEAVRIPESSHSTLCLSTQVGCPLECTFCATGMMGFRRNLSSGEIVEQVVQCRRLNEEPLIRNLVFMGMGEPLLNYDNLIRAIDVLSSSYGPALSQRRMTVSTAGIVPGIRKLSEEGLNVKLAISLNAPTNDLRDRIMPINRKYPIEKLIDAAVDFQSKNGHRITFEYALMPGINDTPEMILELRKWLRKVPSKLNLIPLNPIDKRHRKQHDWDAIFDRFYELFEKERITLTLRRSRGAEIQAACGQLAGR